MSILRTILFNIVFYLSTIVYLIVISPILALPRKKGLWVYPWWGLMARFQLRWIGGIKSEILDVDRIPKGGCIVAIKHQSSWEAITLYSLFQDSAYIIKRDLTYVPLTGWYLLKYKFITVHRGERSLTVAKMIDDAKTAINDGRTIVIFPEGTRQPLGAAPKYKLGICNLYNELGCPVIPIAVNSGAYWPRHGFFCPPGTIRAQVLPAIPPNLPQDEFMKILTESLEEASNRLLDQAEAETPDNHYIKEARERQKQWQANDGSDFPS
ncbi:lysophospholipid acyltransferase family protein [Flexibacterium corallicola]|uniref:lysophospholipid acyltransferase family protein n=1 Tax=Flexibacterium corallicola TaxID=3037259 RepID=UPI00286F82F3|nr:lysophospholipid acyltransferase family protein [Pseudovibrio sp. M1P-2-3]